MSKSKNYPKVNLKYKVTLTFYEYEADGRIAHHKDV